MTNTTTATNHKNRDVVGYEIVERYDNAHGIAASISLWLGDYRRKVILDRNTGLRPCERRCLATITPNEYGSYQIKFHAASNSGIRYSGARSYEDALATVNRWVKRRFERKAVDYV